MPFLHILILGFSSAVALVWLKHHFFVLPDHWLSISLPFLIVSLVTALLYTSSLWYQKKIRPFHVAMRPVFILPIILFFGILIFNTQAFLRGLLLADGPLVPLSAWLGANLSFLEKFTSVLFLFFVLTIALYGAGSSFLRLIAQWTKQVNPENDPLYESSLRIALGIFVWTTLLLILGLIDALHASTIWILFGVFVITEYSTLIHWLKKGFQEFNLVPTLKTSSLLIAFLGLFLIAFTLTQSLRPEPTGYDDMTYYMDRVRFIAEKETLISGGNPYPFELIAAALRIASGDETMFFAMSFATYSFIWGAVILFGFGRALFHHHIGILATVIHLSMPIGAALTIREAKPDPLLLAIILLVFWSLTESLLHFDLRRFQRGLFLFSLAVTIKFTALFLVLPIALTLSFLLWHTHKKRPLSWNLGALTQTLIIALLPFVFWIGYGLTTYDQVAGHSWSSIISSTHVPSESELRSELSAYSQTHQCESTGATEDFARFISDRQPLERLLALPWDITMNLQTGSFATEIGFIFLALLPLYFITRKNSSGEDERKNRSKNILALFALSYFSLWLLFGENVLWYGYPGLALLALLVAKETEHVRAQKILHVFFWALLTIGLLGGTVIQMKLVTERAQILAVSDQISKEKFLEQAVINYETTFTLLNRLPESRIFITSSQLWYGITDNYRRAVMDTHLDMFNCLYRERDDALTLKRFQDFNIRFVLLARSYAAELASPDRPSLDQKIAHFTGFLSRNLRVVWGSAQYTLFEVPRENPL